jgi:hypothetical protein
MLVHPVFHLVEHRPCPESNMRTQDAGGQRHETIPGLVRGDDGSPHSLGGLRGLRMYDPEAHRFGPWSEASFQQTQDAW